jgi:organic radical activating enzyme
MKNKILIKEIFNSIQGEGPYVGANQLFIRFSNCNLNCAYCDTDFKSNLKEYTVDELIKKIKEYKNIHSISLTGGEPLLESEFLYNFLPQINQKIYLETNGTLVKELEKIINFVDIISMDIKLSSTTKMKELFELHKNFIEVAIKYNKEIFLKVVFDENLTEQEIIKTIDIAKKHKLLIVLQPKMEGEKIKLPSSFIFSTYYKFIKEYQNVRLIPQVHKFLEIR